MIIAMGILSVVGAGTMTMIVNSQKNVTQVSSRVYESMLLSDLSQVFSNKDLCTEVLKSSQTLKFVAGAPKLKLNLSLPGYGAIHEGVTLHNSLKITDFYIDSLLPPMPTKVLNEQRSAGMVWIQTQDLAEGNPKRKIKQVGILSLYFDKATNQINACQGQETAPASQICDELGGNWNGAKCVMPVIALYNKGCPGGFYLSGFDNAGNPTCLPLPDPAPAPAPAPVPIPVASSPSPPTYYPPPSPSPPAKPPCEPKPTGKKQITATCNGRGIPQVCTPTGGNRVVHGEVTSKSCSSYDILTILGEAHNAQYWKVESCTDVMTKCP